MVRRDIPIFPVEFPCVPFPVATVRRGHRRPDRQWSHDRVNRVERICAARACGGGQPIHAGNPPGLRQLRRSRRRRGQRLHRVARGTTGQSGGRSVHLCKLPPSANQVRRRRAGDQRDRWLIGVRAQGAHHTVRRQGHPRLVPRHARGGDRIGRRRDRRGDGRARAESLRGDRRRGCAEPRDAARRRVRAEVLHLDARHPGVLGPDAADPSRPECRPTRRSRRHSSSVVHRSRSPRASRS